MSHSPLAVSVDRRKRHPYRSLQAELLFQGIRDALTEAEEVATTIHEAVEEQSLWLPTPDDSLRGGPGRRGGSWGTTWNEN